MKGSENYQVKVKNGAGWRAYDICRLQISVGQSYHEGEKLSATLDWINDRFDKNIICVNDTLQRHNIEFQGHSSDEAFQLSQEAGREWIERNYKAITSLDNFEIIRWESWRQDPSYEYGLEVMNRLYRDKESFRQEVNEEMYSFWERALKKDQTLDPSQFEKFKTHSLRYLLEECAVFQLMFAREEAVDIYPGSTLLPCKVAREKEKLGPKKGLGVRGYTRIDFRRKAA